MKRHIVVEGMDGTGKSNLIEALMHSHLNKRFQLHERASTSVGGPVSNLDRWTDDDINSMAMQPSSIYDRHPLISEPIYGPICRGFMPGMFKNARWLDSRQRLMRYYCLIIWCTPPWHEVERNVLGTEGQHMPGVATHARTLYDAYRNFAFAWPGTSIRYDYTRVPKQSIIDYVSTVFGGFNGKG